MLCVEDAVDVQRYTISGSCDNEFKGLTRSIDRLRQELTPNDHNSHWDTMSKVSVEARMLYSVLQHNARALDILHN